MYSGTYLHVLKLKTARHIFRKTPYSSISTQCVVLFMALYFFQCAIAIQRRIPAGNYMFKVNNRNIRTSCELCSKLTIKIPKRLLRRYGVFNVNFEHIPHLVVVYLLLTLSRKMLAGPVKHLCKIFCDNS